jgi:hypothetical protein
METNANAVQMYCQFVLNFYGHPVCRNVLPTHNFNSGLASQRQAYASVDIVRHLVSPTRPDVSEIETVYFSAERTEHLFIWVW